MFNPKSSIQPKTRPILRSRHYCWIALGFAIFALYGSLVPFHYEAKSFDVAVLQFQKALSKPVKVESRSDWLANILLFIPIGFTALGWRSVDRGEPLLSIGFVLAGCFGLSVLVEFLQVWFPPRNPDPNDIVAETLGGVIGVAFWCGCGQQVTNIARAQWIANAKGNRALPLIPVYLLMLIIAQGMPFDLTISPGELMQKYRNGGIDPSPLPRQISYEFVRKALVNAAYYLPAGILIALWRRRSGRHSTVVWHVVLLGLLLAGAIEFMQIFITSRFASGVDVVTGMLAVVAGWWIVQLWRAASGKTSREHLAWHAFIVWAAILAFVNWGPFKMVDDPTTRWSDVSWIPLTEYIESNYLFALDMMFEKIVLFLPIGFALAACRLSLSVNLAITACLSLMIEAGQLLFSAHNPGITDFLLQIFGGGCGFLIAQRFHFSGLVPERSKREVAVAWSH